MKKLNLLKPNLVKGFLDGGAGQKVEYLRVPENLTLEALEEDVKNGAKAFEDLLDAAKKHVSRVVLVHSDNEEHALMAINYLAGICNEDNDVEDDDCFDDDLSSEYDLDEVLKDYEYSLDDDDDDDQEDTELYHWTESPNRIPVIDYAELCRYSNNYEEFGTGGVISIGLPNMRSKLPYWTKCTQEAVCVIARFNPFTYNGFSNLNMGIERFLHNKHVYIAIINPDLDMKKIEGKDSPLTNGGFGDQEGLEFVLEHNADLIYVTAKEPDLKGYRKMQFENWIEEMSLTLEKKFPVDEIVSKITSIRNPAKSQMMEKIIRYVLKESEKNVGDTLTTEDFAILKKFKALLTEEKTDNTNAKKLENQLIGMESVKEQVRNIVNVMKYNKLREKMGIEKANYHNAHLLIGAPGTAKTTVAKLMGSMMFEENLLPGNRFICVNGADLKGMYVGHSAPKTHQIFENYDVILIDEAYSLTASDDFGGMDSFSQEAIAQLILEIENHPMDKLVMFAGYGGIHVSKKNNKMKQFIDANPGLKSRINSTIYFDSYTPDEMVEIVHRQAKMQSLTVDVSANESIHDYFTTRIKDKNFGNGREARSLLENAMVFAARRIMDLPKRKQTKKAMCEISKVDVEKAIEKMKDNDKMQIGKSQAQTGFAV